LAHFRPNHTWPVWSLSFFLPRLHDYNQCCHGIQNKSAQAIEVTPAPECSTATFLNNISQERKRKDLRTRYGADSSSVETPARSSSRYHGVQATSNPNESIARMNLEPHEYTSGRWLHRNKEQTEARYIEFDYDALCRKAVEQCLVPRASPSARRLKEVSTESFCSPWMMNRLSS
jgi:hypothetical protein